MTKEERQQARYDQAVARKVQREWDRWVDARIKEMEEDLVSLLGRVERLKTNLEAAKWVRSQRKRKRETP